MRRDLEEKLLEQHEKILGNLDYRELFIGDGWYVLVDTLYRGSSI